MLPEPAKNYKPRYEIIGKWSSNGTNVRIVHREYTRNVKYANSIVNLDRIQFADGTYLNLSCTIVPYGEQPKQVISVYNNLISRCLNNNVNSVEELENSE